MRKLLWILGLLTALLFFGSIVFLTIINIKEPKLLDATAWFFFFSALTIAIGSFLALIKVLFIKIFLKDSLQTFHFKEAFRQGLLLGLLLSVSLMLQAKGNLNIITGAIVVMAVVIFEFFLSKKVS